MSICIRGKYGNDVSASRKRPYPASSNMTSEDLILTALH
jgi:hypothetical protein